MKKVTAGEPAAVQTELVVYEPSNKEPLRENYTNSDAWRQAHAKWKKRRALNRLAP